MSETTANTEAPAGEEVTATSETANAENPEVNLEEKTLEEWKAHARKHEDRWKAAEKFQEDAQKWREYQEQQKPIEERNAEKLAQLEAEATEAKVKLLKYEVATEKGIPADVLNHLKGNNRQELEEAADAIISLMADKTKPQTPKPTAEQGKTTNTEVSTAQQFAAAIGNAF